jgi:small conductance mechanosensitive channel
MENLDSRWVSTAVVVGVTLVLYVILIRVGAGFVRQIGSRSPGAASRLATLWVMVRRVIQFVLVVIAVLLVFDIWGLSMAPFIWVGTVIGAAIGFGAQGVVRDILSGFFILAEDQYQIGDTVTIAGTTGTVEDILFRVTVLRDGEGNQHYVPNGQIGVASNATSRYARPVVDVRVGYQADVDRAMDVMLDELNLLAGDPEWSDWITAEPEMMGVQDLADSAVLIRGRLTTVAEQRWSVRREALRRVKKRFDAEGIAFAQAAG